MKSFNISIHPYSHSMYYMLYAGVFCIICLEWCDVLCTVRFSSDSLSISIRNTIKGSLELYARWDVSYSIHNWMSIIVRVGNIFLKNKKVIIRIRPFHSPSPRFICWCIPNRRCIVERQPLYGREQGKHTYENDTYVYSPSPPATILSLYTIFTLSFGSVFFNRRCCSDCYSEVFIVLLRNLFHFTLHSAFW